MPLFQDMLYGTIELPEWIVPFLRIPEFSRLRGVRLSNVDSLDFKDFGSATRWEHCIGAAYLGWRCGERRGLRLDQRITLTLSALLHDVATPPFAHTVEYVLETFDHEIESQRILGLGQSDVTDPDLPILGSLLPRFREECRNLSRRMGFEVAPDEIAECVNGGGDLGFLISGTLDLDNADNVVRGCALMGIDVDRNTPLGVAEWLAGLRSAPTDLERVASRFVQQWRQYRRLYYERFFLASKDEHGRQAYLQHLMRRAVAAGIPRRALIWNTDDGLLSVIGGLQDSREGIALSELVERYRALDQTVPVCEVGIFDHGIARSIARPRAATWIEDTLRSGTFEPFVSVVVNRAGSASGAGLFDQPVGKLLVFKLGGELIWQHLPEWIKSRLGHERRGRRLILGVEEVVGRELELWCRDEPWVKAPYICSASVRDRLNSVGDWGFRLSRNRSIHPYPSTFVHAIPASLVSVLGLGGQLIVDPFGGTGQTAVEVVKRGGTAVSGDSNYIATLVARARTQYLSWDEREYLRSVSGAEIADVAPDVPPEFELREKWHHPRTLDELCRIRSFISAQESEAVRLFLTACFSAVIPSTTARKGKQHGFFADNTPLSIGDSSPPYQDAIRALLDRVRINLEAAERLYSFFERRSQDALIELARARIVRADVQKACVEDYGLQEGRAAAVITSPPYLCMADYTLGNRLSYYWLAPEEMERDFAAEIGARRRRFSPKTALRDYRVGLQSFANMARLLIRPGGYLCTVLGRPIAEAFAGVDLLGEVDEMFEAAGFERLWDRLRPIHWHRNQGYQRLQQERISVHERRS